MLIVQFKIKKVGGLMLVALLLIGCSDIPTEYKPFFRLSPGEKEEAITQYSLEQQIDLMIIGQTIPHPPLLLYFQVAKNGEAIVPLLIQRLSETQDMPSIRPIAICLYEINLQYFEWTADPKYSKTLQNVIAEKSDPSIQKEIKRILGTGKLYP